MKHHPLAWGVSLAVLCGAAAAQSPREVQMLKAIFERYDKDENEVISREEFPGSDRQFQAMDRSKNGKVTFDEYKVSGPARQYLASRNRSSEAPRERVNVDKQTLARLRNLSRFDRNRDGRVTKQEWSGAPAAFTTLDLDRNGTLDSKDRKLAEKKVEGGEAYAKVYEAYKSNVPSVEDIFRRHDKNKDQLLSEAEVAGAKFKRIFPRADRNSDKVLDAYEVRAMVGMLSMRVRQRNYGNLKPRAFLVPFSTWDKNNDDRIDTGEWLTNKELFPRIDLNRDGAVTKIEIDRYKLSVEGDNFIERYDLNGDGKVTRKEFSGPTDAFRRADRNGDGIVSPTDR